MISRILTFIGLFLSVAGLVLLVAGSRALAVEKAASYRDWKSEKIHSCSDRLKVLRIQLSSAKSARDEGALKTIEQDMVQENWRLEVAKELSVKDYMILYVIPQLPEKGASRRLKEIAAVLSKEEVAQVLETYVQLLNAPQAAHTQMRIQALSTDR